MDTECNIPDADSDWGEELGREEDDSMAEDSVSCIYIQKTFSLATDVVYSIRTVIYCDSQC